MLLNISKLSRFCKKQCYFKHKKEDFDDIVRLILSQMIYDHIELTIWSFQVDLFKGIDYKLLTENKKFSTLILTKNNSVHFTSPDIYNEIRLFEINIYFNDKKLFTIRSDNYGEYTSITMDKTVDKGTLLKLFENKTGDVSPS